MKFSKPGLLIAGLVLLTSCSKLPNVLHRDIAYESDRLHSTEHELQRSQTALDNDLSQQPDLFKSASPPDEWKARLRSDREKLSSAEKIQFELSELARRDRADSQSRAEQLLRQERQLLEAARADSANVIATADRWIDFGRDVPSHLDQMRHAYEAISKFDLTPVTKDIEKADHDWPAKKAALDDRLNALRQLPKQAEAEWNATEVVRQSAASEKPSGTQLATLVQTDESLATLADTMTRNTAELASLSGQLYDSWDKILTDLDDSRYGSDESFRERIKTVRTHLLDVASKKSETTSSEHWVNVSEPEFRAVQNDLGMAIAHKDPGLFDSEAQTTPQPAGFAYIAPVSVGSNQYGYWDHSHGHSVWTWLPEYLILRELLWNHDYRPVLADEYRAYRSAQNTGRTYYGQSSPAAPPKYGTHGTFTQTHYADSRYAQHGGFSGSAYANHPGSAAASRPESHNSFGNNDAGGHRFGSGAHPSSGHQFGRPGGFRAGRRFGGRR
ncbi:MAG TPA: hypothetical protein VFA65_09790 [Bryobacteraceae bacterium]|nr:hypothetical protein [Bryobacteraceae bacterium]